MMTKLSASVSLLLCSQIGFFANVMMAKDYNIKVKTGDKILAGTDSNIYITIYGDEGATAERRLDHSFERNSLHTLTLIDLTDVGDLENVKIRSDGSGFGSDWYLSWISVDNRSATFDFWIEGAESATVSFDAVTSALCNTASSDPVNPTTNNDIVAASSPSANPSASPFAGSWSIPLRDYDIKIKTGEEMNTDGTDSNIYLTIYGDKGHTTETRLNDLISGNAFERNSLENFALSSLQDVGNLKSVNIRSDGGGADLYLRWVSVDDRKATVNSWIEGSGNIAISFDEINCLQSKNSTTPDSDSATSVNIMHLSIFLVSLVGILILLCLMVCVHPYVVCLATGR